MTVNTIHRWNAVFLGIFILCHMGNHLSGLFGIETYNIVQTTLRTVYRIPVVEFLLLGSIATQIILGVVLLRRALRRRESGFWPRLQLISGIVFLLFVVQHVPAYLFTRFILALDTTFFWPASVLQTAGSTAYFAPYYFLGVCAVFAHIASAVYFICSGRQPGGQVLPTAILITGILVAIIIVSVFTGVIFDINMPSEWKT